MRAPSSLVNVQKGEVCWRSFSVRIGADVDDELFSDSDPYSAPLIC
jgi:hypothetical protein